MKAHIKGGKLVVELPINNPPARSKSGKTNIVASSCGNKRTEAKVNGQNVFVGVNAYVYPTEPNGQSSD